MTVKFLRILELFTQKASRLFVVIAGFLTILMIFTTSYGVAMRYFFRRPEPISYELTTIFMLWAFLLAVSFVEYRQDHIRADIFVTLMPKALANFLHRIVGPTLAMIYCTILA